MLSKRKLSAKVSICAVPGMASVLIAKSAALRGKTNHSRRICSATLTDKAPCADEQHFSRFSISQDP